MITCSITQAKANWTNLLDRVELGEEVTITRYGKPIAKLVKYEPVPRKLGLLKGQIFFSPDFDTSDEEVEACFVNSPPPLSQLLKGDSYCAYGLQSGSPMTMSSHPTNRDAA